MTTLNPPQNCRSMTELRAEIDALDTEIVDLLVLRASYIDRAIALKPSEGLPARIPERVDEVISKVSHTARDRGLDPQLVEGLWRQLIDWSIDREARVIDRE
ncbi:chorismate mutase [Shimia sp.]|uniref:chorismate mutase n=1 Tax=Shimia sp. TaxID=1954381 RepID=UPI003567CB11